MNPPSHCLECSAPLTAADAGGLCPKCLLRLGLASQLGGSSITDAGTRRFVAPPQFPFDFGDYRVLRLLGRGGMGAVYEAEQQGTGRRVALKVLGHTIDSPEMRKRFLREGRLAASVNHPNTVYIFGTEEIEGAPVIAMELVAGGTLRDWVKRGPVPVREAVDATLQIIAGLEAAQVGGVLHRDVKPANCFVAPDGTVKVGDFGLSVSTLARSDTQLTASGTMLGTPSFAPPEQLRGDELDVRADIYSVGATLYALLTGHAPFEGDHAVNVVAAVLDKAPRAIAEFREDVPAGLVQIVGKCLAKRSGERFASYAALREALLPFSSEAREPAPPGVRTIAGFLDYFFATFPGLVFLVLTGGETVEYRWLSARTLPETALFLGMVAFGIGYFAILEGLWGASFGKRLCGLRVVGAGRAAPGLPRATVRAAFVVLLMYAASFVQLFISSGDEVARMMERQEAALYDVMPPVLPFLLFLTMRRRNGFAALHDLLTGTRVILRPKASERPRFEAAPAVAPAVDEKTERLGPFRVLAPIAGAWFSGYDEALRRTVWIRKRAATEPTLSAARRDLGRAGRLRWIAGMRGESDAWDVFDAPAGKPLTELPAQPWAAVRCWLLDLAEELDAGARDGTLPPEIGVDHIWITTAGRALLLDEPWPSSSQSEHFACREIGGVQRLLDAVVTVSLDRTRLPLHAREFLKKLTAATFDRASFIIGNLRSLLAKPATLPRSRRFLSIALAPGLTLFVGILLGIFIEHEHEVEEAKWIDHAELRPLGAAVEFRDTLLGEGNPFTGSALAMFRVGPEFAGQLTVQTAKYISGNFGRFVDSPEFETTPPFAEWSPEKRASVRELVRMNPDVDPEELKRINNLLTPIFERQAKSDGWIPAYFAMSLLTLVAGLACMLQLFSLLIFGTTLGQRLFGFGVVNRRGELAGRGRMLGRWMLIWLLPALLLILGLSADYAEGLTRARVALLSVTALAWLVSASIAVACPARGIHDILAGTRLVPR